MKYLFTILCFLSLQAKGQYATGFLYISSSDHETRLDFNDPGLLGFAQIGGPKGIGVSIGHIQPTGHTAHFYVSGGNTYYTSTNSDFPYAFTGNGDETPICKVPGSDDLYYIFNSTTPSSSSKLIYTILNTSFEEVLNPTPISNYPQYIDSLPDYTQGQEIVRIPNSENYWYITRKKDVGIKRFKVDENGIHSPEVILPYTDENWGTFGELDYHNGKIASTSWTSSNPTNKEVLLFDFDPISGVASNPIVFLIDNAFGVEFSPDGSKLYITCQTNTQDNLYQYNMIDSSMQSIQIETEGYGLNAIEMGPDGKLYIAPTHSHNFFRIDNPNSDEITITSYSTSNTIYRNISDPIQSDVYPGLELTSTSINPSCGNTNDGSITVFANAGTPPYTYQWNDSENQTTATATNLSAGDYTVWVQDSNGIQTIHTVNITSAPAIVIEEQVTNATCYNSTDGQVQIDIQGGTPPYDVLWFNEDPMQLGPGDYEYMIIDNGNCSVINIVTVSSPDEFHFNPYVQNGSCVENTDGLIQINPTGGIQPLHINWIGPDNFSSSQTTLENLDPGYYQSTITDDVGCTKTDTFKIELDGYLSFSDFTIKPDACDQGGMSRVEMLNGIWPYYFLWFQNGEIISDADNIHNLEYGNYQILVTDQNDCSSQLQDVFIDTTRAPICQFNPIDNSIFKLNQDVFFHDLSYSPDSVNITQWDWTFGDGEYSTDQFPQHQYTKDGQYQVQLKITDEYGCAHEQYHLISVYDDNLCFIPNAFSPNGDSHNDYFKPIISNLDEATYQIEIYGKWGKFIFSSTDYDKPWDGKLNGVAVEQGMYSYNVNFKTLDGKHHNPQGIIHLIR